MNAFLADTVAAIGDGHEDALGGGGQAAEHVHSLEVGGPRGNGIAVAQGRADQRRQWDDSVGAGHEHLHQGLVAAIAPHDLEAPVVAAIRQAGLPEQEVIEHSDFVPQRQEAWGEHGSDVAGAAGD